MNRVECLKEIIALEETHAALTRRFDELCGHLRDLNHKLPPQNPRKPPALDRIACFKAILTAEEERAAVIEEMRAKQSRLKALRRAMPPEPNPQGAVRHEYGAVRQAVLHALKAAGAKGLRLKELSERTGLDARHICATLCGHMRDGTLPGLRRIGRSHYVLEEKRKKSRAVHAQ